MALLTEKSLVNYDEQEGRCNTAQPTETLLSNRSCLC